jgi:hypothetical protein
MVSTKYGYQYAAIWVGIVLVRMICRLYYLKPMDYLHKIFGCTSWIYLRSDLRYG